MSRKLMDDALEVARVLVAKPIDFEALEKTGVLRSAARTGIRLLMQTDSRIMFGGKRRR